MTVQEYKDERPHLQVAFLLLQAKVAQGIKLTKNKDKEKGREAVEGGVFFKSYQDSIMRLHLDDLI